MGQRRVRAVVMRGGTSKGLFFHRADLPDDAALRDRIILTAFGGGDPYGRQIDYGGTCGNLTAAVGPLAIEVGATVQQRAGEWWWKR